MRIAYLDCFSGISGDMFLGALLDAGVPFELFEKTVAGLNIGAAIQQSRVDRGGVSAIKLDVIVNGQKDLPREEFWEKQGPGARGQGSELSLGTTHAHNHVSKGSDERIGSPAGENGLSHPANVHLEHHTHAAHAHEHSEHDANAAHAVETQPSRGLSDILRIISSAPIPERAKQAASEIFLALGAAEAKIHNVTIEGIHFHEVGAADAIVDIVCAAVGAETLGVEQIVCSPLNVGSGTVACAHGVLPVPAPATLELLKDAPIYSGEIQKELVTPTGAAIVKVLVSSFGPRPQMRVDTVGYGAGSRNFSGHPNVLRLSIGETADELSSGTEGLATEEIAILEANLDDLNPQVIGYIVDRALAEGALDVFTTPAQMKKNRPGTVLTVLARPEQEEWMRALLFRESSTLGVRTRREKRYVLPRHYESVVTRWGGVRMKIATKDGAVLQYAPEYEDCRRLAAEHHVPLKAVMQEAIRLYLDRENG